MSVLSYRTTCIYNTQMYAETQPVSYFSFLSDTLECKFTAAFFIKHLKDHSVCVCVGPARGWFQRSKALQIQACLQMVMEWASRSGLGHLAEKFFTKLNSTVSIIATPPQQLTQVTPPHKKNTFTLRFHSG